MLQRLADHIADSYTRAADSESRARQAAKESGRVIFAWIRVASFGQNYEFVESLEPFLLDLHKKSWPLNVEDLPMEEGS
jgi:hypothetical protein